MEMDLLFCRFLSRSLHLDSAGDMKTGAGGGLGIFDSGTNIDLWRSCTFAGLTGLTRGLAISRNGIDVASIVYLRAKGDAGKGGNKSDHNTYLSQNNAVAKWF